MTSDVRLTGAPSRAEGVPSPAKGVDDWLPRPELAIFVFGLVAVVQEVGLARLLSFKLQSFEVHAVVSVGVAGLGCGALLVGHRLLAGASPAGLLAGASAVGALLTPAMLWVLATLSFDTAAIFQGPEQLLRLFVLGLAVWLPFVAWGSACAALIGSAPRRTPRLHGFFLAGCAVSVLGVTLVLNWLTPSSLVWIASGIAAWTGAAVVMHTRRAIAMLNVGLGALLLAAGFVEGALPTIRTDASKNLQEGIVSERTFWTPYRRIDVAHFPWQAAIGRGLLYDGVWYTDLVQLASTSEDLSEWKRDPRSLPYRIAGRPLARVALLGVAAQRGILTALAFDSQQVIAVEDDPATLDLLAGEFSEFTGSLARDPRVEFRAQSSRRFLQEPDPSLDLVHLSVPLTTTALDPVSLTGFALYESSLFTQEALEAALERLAPEGLLCIHVHEWRYDDEPFRSARLVSTVRSALQALGRTPVGPRVMVITTEGIGQLVTILVKPDSFGDADIERLLAAAGDIDNTSIRFAAGHAFDDGMVIDALIPPGIAARPQSRPLTDPLAGVRDRSPFPWHFQDLLFPSSTNTGRVEMLNAGAGESEAVLRWTLVSVLAFWALVSIGAVLGNRASGRPFMALMACGMAAGVYAASLVPWTGPLLASPGLGARLAAAVFWMFMAAGVAFGLRGHQIGPVQRLLGIGLLAGVALVDPATLGDLDLVGGIGLLALPAGLIGTIIARSLAAAAASGGAAALGWALLSSSTVAGAVVGVVLSLAIGFDGLLVLGLCCGSLAIVLGPSGRV